MDTPDKAADLADSQLADSSNKEWLLASARSGQLSTDLRRYKFECSINSNNANYLHHRNYNYGTSSIKIGNRNQEILSNEQHEQPSESSWLMKNYQVIKKKTIAKRANLFGHGKQRQCNENLMCTKYTINNHIYDNISFADSPILRSLSRKIGDNEQEEEILNDEHEQEGEGEKKRFLFNEKFRLFLACYVLLGITVAIYSRNALSLAAVGMIANNAMNKELAETLSNLDTQTIGILAAPATSVAGNSFDDGNACPIKSKRNLLENNSTYQQMLISAAAITTTLQQQINERKIIESNLKESIRMRIENGSLVDWSPSEQGLIFAAGSVGNLLIAIPLTRLGEIYGPKWIIFIASFGATIQAALMPIISPCNVYIVILFQIIFNGLTYGADCVAYTLFAHWLTPTEMAFFVSCLLICYQLGTILSSFATAKILSENWSWSWCFYMPAILCAIWTLIWALIGASDPTKSRLISKKELNYLLRNSKIAMALRESKEVAAATTTTNTSEQFEEIRDQNERQKQIEGQKQKQNQMHPISWLKLAKDPNIWAICAVKFTMRWYFSVYLSLMPTYLSSVAHMSVGTIGQMSVGQSFIGLFSGILMGFLTKSLVTKRPFNMSLATTRKFFQSIVNFGLAISLIVFIIYDCDQLITIITLTLGGICINFYVAAALQLPLDLSPNHCGLITSITNTLAFGQALGAPIAGLILNNGPKDRALWRIVWLISIVMNLISGLIFIFLVDSKPRDYSKQTTNNNVN